MGASPSCGWTGGGRVNVLSRERLEELRFLLDRLGSEPAALLLVGNGRGSFLAGADLHEIAELDPLRARDLARAGQALTAELSALPLPTAAVVDGHALGGGFDVAMACDLVVATRRSRFGHPGIRRGLFTGWGGTVRLPRRGRRPALAAALLDGEELTAGQARDAGLLFDVVRSGGVAMQRAQQAVLRLAGWPPAALAAWRAARRGAPERGLAASLARLSRIERRARLRTPEELPEPPQR